MCVYISMCVCGPLPTSGASQSGTGTGNDSGGSDVILSQMVYGELVICFLFDNFKLKIPDFCMSFVWYGIECDKSFFLCRSSRPAQTL